VLIRPLGDKPDDKMDQGDLAVYRQVEAWAKEFTGYPTVSGFHEFLYEPEKPLKGDLTDYAYHQRGAHRLRDRAVGPLHADRHRAQEALRGRIQPSIARTTSRSPSGTRK
jgi:hypothetical protein